MPNHPACPTPEVEHAITGPDDVAALLEELPHGGHILIACGQIAFDRGTISDPQSLWRNRQAALVRPRCCSMSVMRSGSRPGWAGTYLKAVGVRNTVWAIVRILSFSTDRADKKSGTVVQTIRRVVSAREDDERHRERKEHPGARGEQPRRM